MKSEQASELTRADVAQWARYSYGEIPISDRMTWKDVRALCEHYLRTTEAAPSGGEGEPINLDGLLTDAAIVESYAGTSGSEIAKGVAKNIRTAVAELRRLRTPTPPQSSPAVAPKESGAVAWRKSLHGMSVSMDVSTGDADNGNRIFGDVYEVMDDRESKHGVILLAIESSRNFTAPPSPPAAPLRAALLALAAKWREEADEMGKADLVSLTHKFCLKDHADELESLTAQRGDEPCKSA